MLDIELRKGSKAGGFDDAKRYPFSLGRVEGRTGCKSGAAVDMELRNGLMASGFADDLGFREGFPVDIELKKGLKDSLILLRNIIALLY